jgi:hypothetical protein
MAIILSFITQKYDLAVARVNEKFITQKHDFWIKSKFYNTGSRTKFPLSYPLGALNGITDNGINRKMGSIR